MYEMLLVKVYASVAALRPIHFDEGTLQDVIVWYYFTVFYRPTSRVGCQVVVTHDLLLVVYGFDRP
jgi:hypothetical protein